MPEHGAPWPEESIKMKKLEPTDYLGTTPNCMGHCSRRGQGNARPRPTLNARYKLRVDHYYLGRCVLDNYMLIGKGGRDAATAYFYIRCPVVCHTTNHFKTRERSNWNCDGNEKYWKIGFLIGRNYSYYYYSLGTFLFKTWLQQFSLKFEKQFRHVYAGVLHWRRLKWNAINSHENATVNRPQWDTIKIFCRLVKRKWQNCIWQRAAISWMP